MVGSRELFAEERKAALRRVTMDLDEADELVGSRTDLYLTSF